MEPFESILTMCQHEAFYLYNFTRSVLNLPTSSGEEQIDGLLYKAAFAFLFGDFLTVVGGMKAFEDFEIFVDESLFNNKREELETYFQEILSEYEQGEDFYDRLWFAILRYQDNLINGIIDFFETDGRIKGYLMSIFDMCGNVYKPVGYETWANCENFVNQMYERISDEE